MRTNKMGLHFLLPLIIALLACNKPQESLNWINNYTPTTENPGGEGEDPGTDEPGTEDPGTPVNPGAEYIIVGYDYDSSEKSNLPDPTLVTHINFAFGKIDSDYKTLVISKSKRLKNVVALKESNPNLKVCLSIGGWEAGNFSEMAADPALRKAFCENCLAAVNTYGLDGIDIDWEYPSNNSCKPKPANQAADTENFTYLIQDLRKTLGPNKLVTMAASANAGAGYVNFPEFIDDMDWVNIMTYDMGSPKDGKEYHNAGLYKSGKTKRSCDESVTAHVAAGVPLNKIVLGMPFYGRDDNVTFTADDDDNYVSYKNILPILSGGKYTECWDNTAMVPYLTNSSGKMVLTYDNEESIGMKANYVKEKGLKGAMYWSIRDDDSDRTLARAISTRLIGTGYQEGSASIPSYQVTNSYVQTYMDGVHYTDWDFSGTQVLNYQGGGPGEADVPPSVTISWKAASTSQTLKVWDDDWSREYTLGAGVGSQSISNLVPGSHYHYRVTNSGNSVVAKGEFKTTGALHQIYFNDKVRNARDFGGLKTLDGKTIRYRLLYRGGRTNYIKSDGKEEAKAVGIRAELDLMEKASSDNKSYFGSDVAYCAPLFEESENYGTMLKNCQDRVKQGVQFIFDNIKQGKPVYFHCAAGRDRTGTIAALLLALLNVREADIARDYELTYFAPEDWSMSTNKETGEKYFNHTRNVGSYTKLVTYIRDFENAGSLPLGAQKYLLAIGIDQQDINDFKTIMLK